MAFCEYGCVKIDDACMKHAIQCKVELKMMMDTRTMTIFNWIYSLTHSELVDTHTQHTINV